MSFNEIARRFLEQHHLPNEGEKAFESLRDSFYVLMDSLYPGSEVPIREDLGSLGYKCLSNPYWEKPKDFKYDGCDLAEQVLSMVLETTSFKVRIETSINEEDEEGLLLPPAYRVLVEPDVLQPGLRLEFYFPFDLPLGHDPINISGLVKDGAVEFTELAHLGRYSSEEDVETPQNVLLGIIMKDPVLSLKFADWFFRGLATVEELAQARSF